MTLKPSLKPVDFDPFADEELVYTAPITESQREIWLATQMGDAANCAFNESTILHLQGELDKGLVETAVAYLIQRHNALRTNFSADGESLCIHKDIPNPVVFTDISSLTDEEKATRTAHYAKTAVTTPFDLVHEPLIRVQILKLSATQHQLILTLHHIIADGWSMGLLTNEIGKIYKAAFAGIPPQLPPSFQFSDYAYLEQARQQDHKSQHHEDYWVKQYANDIPSMALPTDRPHPNLRTYESGFVSRKIDDELIHAMRKIGTQSGCTLFTTFLSAYALFLHRLQSESDLVIGIPAAGQAIVGQDYLVGHCVNMLPLRCYVDSTQTFSDLLKETRQRLLDAHEHQEFTFGSLLNKLPILRDPGRIPLIPVTFNINQEKRLLDFGSAQGHYITNPRFSDAFEMKVNVIDSKNGFFVECNYNRALFDEATMQRRVAEFETLIKSVVDNPNGTVSTLPLLPANEQDLLLNQWNQTETTYDPRPIPELIQAQAKVTPDAIAIRCGEHVLSYQQLDEQSNQVAHYLKAYGVTINALVGLGMGRSLNRVVVLLGIWKAGGAYVPLDPAYPKARLSHMVKDSGMTLLIAEAEYTESFNDFGVNSLVWEDIYSEIKMNDMTSLALPINNRQRAYVIYTSGSTGLPKGVQIPHQALTNFLWSMQQEPGLCANDILACVTTLSFDIHGLELWLPLITGAEVVIVTQEVSMDGSRLAKLLDETDTTIMQATPATWKLLLESGWNGRSQLKMLCGGEPLPEQLAETLLEKGGELWNMYGPTETTIWSSISKIEPNTNPITIGRPIANTQMYILNTQLQPVPIGVSGELYIGGDGVALGYLHRDELTQERFIANPFGPGKIYNTGDLARYRAAGEIICLGRSDFQVKVRGYRIELGEIEAVLARHPQLTDVIVIVREDQEDDKRIVAYYRSDDQKEVADLREFINQAVPYYMVPTHFIRLDTFPLTPNGKIAREALPEPDYSQTQSKVKFAKARTELEAQLVDIWQRVLKVKPIGIHDDFFYLGGHSLMALRLFAKLEEEMGQTLPLVTLFEAPTIAALATRMKASASEQKEWSVLAPIQPKGDKAPFFYVAPYAISVLQFNDIGSHFRERPFYGIQPLGLNENEEIHTSIEEMATYYIEAIQSVQPHGPYYLGGHCAGAWVAYEIALQLEQLGETVGYLAIVDKAAPNYVEPGRGTLSHIINRVTYYTKDRRLLYALGWKLKFQAEKWLLYRHGSPQVQRIQTMRNAHDQAFVNYQVHSGYTGSMTILCSSDNNNIFATDEWYKNWLEFTPQTVEIIDIDSTHAMLIFNPQARELAHHFMTGIQQVEQSVPEMML